MSVAFLFPGQGAQYPNMLHELPKHPEVQRTIEEASEVLGRNVLELDTKEPLASTVSVQLSLLISGVALARVLKSFGAVPDIVAGHSIGSFAAAVVCGTLDFKDAVSLVEIRAKMMEKSFPEGYGMGAIVGIDESRVISLVDKVNTKKSPVYIANINTDNQIVISGKISAIEEVFSLVHTIGVYKTKILNVSVPSHCELLNDISKELEKKISNLTLTYPKTLFIGNCRARGLRKAEDIGKELADGIVDKELLSLKVNSKLSHGEKLYLKYKNPGVRGEVEKGIPTAFEFSLDFYRNNLYLNLNDRLVHTLIGLMSVCNDTTIIHRHNIETLEEVKKMSESIISLGGMNTVEGRAEINKMNEEFIKRNISPGGSADLLAVTVFLHLVSEYLLTL